MQIQVNLMDNILDIQADGRIDASNANDFYESILNALQEHNSATALIINFANIAYISSAGLRVILLLAKECKSKLKKFACYTINDNVLEVFKISGFNTIIKISDTKDELLQDLS